MNLKVYPTLKVHAWGGLGSQLFAIALIIDLKTRFPKRNMELVLHNGGVTKRPPEVLGLIPNLRIRAIDDYSLNIPAKNSSKLSDKISSRKFFLNCAKLICIKLGLISNGNTNYQWKTVKPWVIAFRGHYSSREISEDVLSLIYKKLLAFNTLKNKKPYNRDVEAAIHYRLGDLLHLKNKQQIRLQRLSNIINSPRLSNIHEYTVFSDSPKDAIELLCDIKTRKRFTKLNLDTCEMLICASKAKTFIGTNSKLSIWIIIFQQIQNENYVFYLPAELCAILKSIYPRLAKNLDTAIY